MNVRRRNRAQRINALPTKYANAVPLPRARENLEAERQRLKKIEYVLRLKRFGFKVGRE